MPRAAVCYRGNGGRRHRSSAASAVAGATPRIRPRLWQQTRAGRKEGWEKMAQNFPTQYSCSTKPAAQTKQQPSSRQLASTAAPLLLLCGEAQVQRPTCECRRVGMCSTIDVWAPRKNAHLTDLRCPRPKAERQQAARPGAPGQHSWREAGHTRAPQSRTTPSSWPQKGSTAPWRLTPDPQGPTTHTTRATLRVLGGGGVSGVYVTCSAGQGKHSAAARLRSGAGLVCATENP